MIRGAAASVSASGRRRNAETVKRKLASVASIASARRRRRGGCPRTARTASRTIATATIGAANVTAEAEEDRERDRRDRDPGDLAREPRA